MIAIIISAGILAVLALIANAVYILVSSFFKKSSPTDDDVETGMKASSSSEDKDADDSDDYIDPDYRVPYSTDSEPEGEDTDPIPTTSTQLSTDYDSEAEENERWEQFKLAVAPAGPVAEDQVLLVLTCPEDKLYRKAILNKDHIEIGVYQKMAEGLETYAWMFSKCSKCNEEFRRQLEAHGLPIVTGEHFETVGETVKEQEKVDEAAEEQYYDYVLV